jgi:hypothetical protein
MRQATYARIGYSTNTVVKDYKGYIVQLYPFFYTKDVDTIVCPFDFVKHVILKIFVASVRINI